ncbi:hypothetical protein EYF80_031368 [Liparis tanakae]|uniref:Uncharacterized protein n=1 Tax=Liparis tanakae TaxID=230148 RepID=A0A4Z2GXN0_9TELE|nr:hypothetical protein EYF80_031368 [Liparis tanakae]
MYTTAPVAADPRFGPRPSLITVPAGPTGPGTQPAGPTHPASVRHTPTPGGMQKCQRREPTPPSLGGLFVEGLWEKRRKYTVTVQRQKEGMQLVVMMMMMMMQKERAVILPRRRGSGRDVGGLGGGRWLTMYTLFFSRLTEKPDSFVCLSDAQRST